MPEWVSWVSATRNLAPSPASPVGAGVGPEVPAAVGVVHRNRAGGVPGSPSVLHWSSNGAPTRTWLARVTITAGPGRCRTSTRSDAWPIRTTVLLVVVREKPGDPGAVGVDDEPGGEEDVSSKEFQHVHVNSPVWSRWIRSTTSRVPFCAKPPGPAHATAVTRGEASASHSSTSRSSSAGETTAEVTGFFSAEGEPPPLIAATRTTGPY